MPRKIELKLTNGVTVVLAKIGTVTEGMSISWVTQVESEHLILSVPRAAKASSTLLLAKKFSVNILSQGQEDIARIYGGSESKRAEKTGQMKIELSKDDIPFLSDCYSGILCEIDSVSEIVEQVLIVGKILKIITKDNPRCQDSCEPLIYEKLSYFS